MLTVHHRNNSRSQRILWMLEELGLEYRIKFHERRADMTAPAELKHVHPLGKSPILEDDHQGRNIVLVETGAICEYLVERSGVGSARSRSRNGSATGSGVKSASAGAFGSSPHTADAGGPSGLRGS